jgi:hypothetical protein
MNGSRSILRSAFRGSLACAATLALAGCLNPTVCTSEDRLSLSVQILDARTDAPAADGATVLVKSSDFSDSVEINLPAPDLDIPYTLSESEAGEGRYEVRVRKPGYQEWRLANVLISRGSCHVRAPALLIARLQAIDP